MRRHLLVVATVAALGTAAIAADRSEIRVSEARIFPENLTSTSDGAIYIGSMELGGVYRASPGSSTADTWIAPKSNGLQQILGVLADEASRTLWVCSSASGGRGDAPVIGETAVKAFNLTDGSLKGSYPFPGGGFCNDVTVAGDGTLYATDTTGGRVLRLKKGAGTLEPWVAGNPLLAVIDGLAILGDGAVYVNSFSQGTLARIPVNKDGTAGPVTKLDVSRPLTRPDGMRTVGAHTMLLIEGNGRLDEITVRGDHADVTTLRENLDEPTGVTLTQGRAFISEGRLSLRGKSGDPGPVWVLSIPYPEAR